ncbi:DNA repair protein RecN (Recombination protein N) [Dyadobacter jejuensis]|uniref:DNA repair protein RecN n=1 Tax=Dyadobacter jejuensis TaxID=1082580 RepID=A0A316B3H0_9BACT|nr:DNA repair protein RecN [Dyadobacter jejuensis]PWJ57107.1 DNA repair protein RecN (Recombination protein N) [Dyadobacter jejuensis]
MLSNLLIKNYALIKHLEMSPDAGLNIITGETGAGKSIMLGAIGLLLGNRADVKSLYDPKTKCVIEGTFNLSGYDMTDYFDEENLDFSNECLVRREISVSGKSRAFINDTPVNLETLRKISNQLLDIHSQHDSIQLGSNEFQLKALDAYANNDSLLKQYRTAYFSYKEKEKYYKELLIRSAQLRKEFDYDQFLFQELESVKIQSDELEKLEQELLVLENAVDIKEKLQLAHTFLDNPESSALESLKSTVLALTQAGRLVSDYDFLKERAQSCLIELRDIADEINQFQQNIDFDQSRTDLVQERLNTLYTLLKKHQVNSLAELLAIQSQLDDKLNTVINMDESIDRADKELQKTKSEMLRLAEELSEQRKKVAQPIETIILDRLRDLGIPNASFSIKTNKTDPSPTGMDAVSFLFSGNKGIQPQELKQVASGGEFSRLMMVIKYILADKRRLPTIIFDEIDTGVSGEIAIKMGKMMLNMAVNHQIIAITHLHQIASSGHAHYFVYKDHSSAKTESNIRKLSKEERIQEIAQMIGGHNPSEAIVNNARDMITQTD